MADAQARSQMPNAGALGRHVPIPVTAPHSGGHGPQPRTSRRPSPAPTAPALRVPTRRPRLRIPAPARGSGNRTRASWQRREPLHMLSSWRAALRRWCFSGQRRQPRWVTLLAPAAMPLAGGTPAGHAPAAAAAPMAGGAPVATPRRSTPQPAAFHHPPSVRAWAKSQKLSLPMSI